MAHSPWPTTQLPRMAVGVELVPASASTRGVRCNVHTHTRLVQTWRRRGSKGSGYLGRPHDICDASLHAVNSLVGGVWACNCSVSCQSTHHMGRLMAGTSCAPRARKLAPLECRSRCLYAPLYLRTQRGLRCGICFSSSHQLLNVFLDIDHIRLGCVSLYRFAVVIAKELCFTCSRGYRTV